MRISGSSPAADRFGASASDAGSGFTLILADGVPKTVLDEGKLTKLLQYYDDPSMVVHVHPRKDVRRVLGRASKPYAFRGFTRGGVSYVFWDDTETPQSLAWMIAHELCHQLVDRSPTVGLAMADARAADLDPVSDHHHEVDAEERFCDGIATRLIGQRLDRAWWRRRVPRS